MKTLQKIIRWPFLALIRLYQHTLSFDHGPMKALFPHGYCQFYPTCSEYTYQAIDKYGVISGSVLGAWRILRCNPWAKGGNDPVPTKFKLPRFEKRWSSTRKMLILCRDNRCQWWEVAIMTHPACGFCPNPKGCGAGNCPTRNEAAKAASTVKVVQIEGHQTGIDKCVPLSACSW